MGNIIGGAGVSFTNVNKDTKSFTLNATQYDFEVPVGTTNLRLFSDSGDDQSIILTPARGIAITRIGSQEVEFESFGVTETDTLQSISERGNITNNKEGVAEELADLAIRLFDTAGAYDNTTNYRFTPLTAGKYFVYASVQINAGDTAQAYSQLFIYKNGSVWRMAQQDNGSNPITNNNLFVSAIVDMNGSTDYVECFGRLYGNASTFQFLPSTKNSYFGAYKIIE